MIETTTIELSKEKIFEKKIKAWEKNGTRHDWRRKNENKKLYIYDQSRCRRETSARCLFISKELQIIRKVSQITFIAHYRIKNMLSNSKKRNNIIYDWAFCYIKTYRQQNALKKSKNNNVIWSWWKVKKEKSLKMK